MTGLFTNALLIEAIEIAMRVLNKQTTRKCLKIVSQKYEKCIILSLSKVSSKCTGLWYVIKPGLKVSAYSVAQRLRTCLGESSTKNDVAESS